MNRQRKVLDFEKINFYQLLEITPEASLTDIKNAYRKKAFQCHPLRDLTNEKAFRQFDTLSKVFGVLTHKVARKVYDQVLKRKNEMATGRSDSKRQKLDTLCELDDEEELELRAADEYAAKTPEKKLEQEIEWLEKDGWKQVQSEIELMTNELKKKGENAKYKLTVEWDANRLDDNGGYTIRKIEHKFLVYGPGKDNCSVVVLQGHASVEYVTMAAANAARLAENNTGIEENPLRIRWALKPIQNKRTIWDKIMKKERLAFYAELIKFKKNTFPAFMTNKRPNEDCVKNMQQHKEKIEIYAELLRQEEEGDEGEEDEQEQEEGEEEGKDDEEEEKGKGEERR